MSKNQDRWSVGPWMTPNPQTITPETLAAEAFAQMATAGFRHLLITEGKKLLGIVSDRDLRRVIADEASTRHRTENPSASPDLITVRSLMSTEVKSVRSNDRLEKALKLMIFHKISALPVLNQRSRVVGILSSHDVMTAFAVTLDEYGPALRQSG